MQLAIFDLDDTLIQGDSDHAWGQFLSEKGLVKAEVYNKKNDAFFEDYKKGTLDIFAYQSFVLEPLKKISASALEKLQDEFTQTKIAPIVRPGALELIQTHKKQQHQLLIITATNRIITQPIAKLLQIDELIATEAEIVSGRVTGKIIDTPSFQEGKVIRLKKWLTGKNYQLADAYFYSDSFNDLPLLNHVGKPHAVHPDEKLERHANNKGWPIIYFD